jgi:hypothetical protein
VTTEPAVNRAFGEPLINIKRNVLQKFIHPLLRLGFLTLYYKPKLLIYFN